MPSKKVWACFWLVGFLLLLPTGYSYAVDPWDTPATTDDTAANTKNVLIPGDPPQRHDAEAKAGPTADQDWYRLTVVAGHSYEVRVGARQDSCMDFVGANFQVFQSDATTLITTGVDYPGTGAISSYRAIFIAPSNNNVFVQLMGGTTCTATSSYTIQVFDTTLLSPRWSTFGGFYTSWGFENTTSAPILGTLTVVTSSGTVVANTTFTIQPGRVVFRDTRPTDLNFAPNQAGNVIFSHNGPVGGIVADGFMSNEGGAVFVTIPVKFERALKGD